MRKMVVRSKRIKMVVWLEKWNEIIVLKKWKDRLKLKIVDGNIIEDIEGKIGLVERNGEEIGK